MGIQKVATIIEPLSSLQVFHSNRLQLSSCTFRTPCSRRACKVAKRDSSNSPSIAIQASEIRTNNVIKVIKRNRYVSQIEIPLSSIRSCKIIDQFVGTVSCRIVGASLNCVFFIGRGWRMIKLLMKVRRTRAVVRIPPKVGRRNEKDFCREFGMGYLGYMVMILRRDSNTFLKRRLRLWLGWTGDHDPGGEFPAILLCFLSYLRCGNCW